MTDPIHSDGEFIKAAGNMVCRYLSARCQIFFDLPLGSPVNASILNVSGEQYP